MSEQPESDGSEREEKVGVRAVAGSVLAAMFGVRGGKAHERDFTRGKPSAYIIVGLIFTAVFVGVLVGVVMLVLHFAAT